eukprot:1159496-Pelagomonas_calceolata.AAC.12
MPVSIDVRLTWSCKCCVAALACPHAQEEGQTEGTECGHRANAQIGRKTFVKGTLFMQNNKVRVHAQVLGQQRRSSTHTPDDCARIPRQHTEPHSTQQHQLSDKCT